MSTKHDQIDLNADVSADHENEARSPVIRDSVAETLKKCSKGQGRVQDSVVDKVRVCESAEVICDLNIDAEEVNVSGQGIDGEIDALDSVVDVQKGNECLDREDGMEVDEEGIAGCDNDVSKPVEDEVEAAQVNERASGEVGVSRDANAELVMEVSEQGTYVTTKSSSFDEDLIHSPTHKSEEVTSDSFENQDVEIDTQPEYSEDQLVDIHNSEVEAPSDVLNKSYVVNLDVDLSPFFAKDGNVTGNGSTKLVASKAEFFASDLVWGKVRSHPWWPGQIFDLSAASQKAKKYFRKDTYLIAYFGDQTFAWNEPSKIKPFREHFAQMEKQSSLEDFHYAVDCALEEVSRRVEFGLACSCIPEEAYAKIKTQIIINAGITKESSARDGGDSFSDSSSFDPVKLFEHIQALAQPLYYSADDRLEFVTTKAQLSAFYRWKGYLQLPEFNMLGGLLDSDAEIPLSGEVKHHSEGMQNAAPDLKDHQQVSSGMGKSKSQDDTSHELKQHSDSTHPSKKEKSLMDLLAERCTNMSTGKRESDSKGERLNSSSSGKKRKVVNLMSDDVTVKHKKLDSISDYVTMKQNSGNMSPVKHAKSNLSSGAANKCVPIQKTFGVGNSILKVASQLNGSSSILKFGDGISPKSVVNNKSKEKSVVRNSRSKKNFPLEDSSSGDFLSQLCLAARDPMTRHSFLISLVSFFSEFRNSVSLEKSQGEVSGDRIRNTLSKSETTETSKSEHIKDPYWTDRVIESIPEEQQSLENKNEAGEVLHETPSQKDISPIEAQLAIQLNASLEPEQQSDGDNLELEEVKRLDTLDGCCKEDVSPTALILNFTDSDSVPSIENLNNIFSRFGPLNELETEVLKSKRAKVVFKRRADAETAFSSAGKYSIFGPSLISYCLKYMPSTPIKASDAPLKKRKVASSVEGNAT